MFCGRPHCTRACSRHLKQKWFFSLHAPFKNEKSCLTCSAVQINNFSAGSQWTWHKFSSTVAKFASRELDPADPALAQALRTCYDVHHVIRSIHTCNYHANKCLCKWVHLCFCVPASLYTMRLPAPSAKHGVLCGAISTALLALKSTLMAHRSWHVGSSSSTANLAWRDATRAARRAVTCRVMVTATSTPTQNLLKWRRL